MSRPPGLPLLSGPPPPHSGLAQSACRKCAREFSIIFNRRRECMHCGFDYCSSCTDFQALLPRRGPARGYGLAPVCAYCIDMLNVTALGRAQLRLLPLAKLRRYINAYNIQVKNPIDKNDLVDAAVAARTSQGCLSPVNEDYYRKHSVPSPPTLGSSSPSPSTNRNSPARGSSSANTNSNSQSNRSFTRPDLDPDHQQRPQEAPYTTYTPRTAQSTRPRTTSSPMSSGTRPASEQSDIPRPTGQQSTQHNTSTSHTSSHQQTAPPLPPPPMSTLVTLPRSSISALSVGTLKQILWEARVRVPPGIVEKEELVERVWALVEEEKRKDDEGLEDPNFDMDEDIEVHDREEEVVVEMVDPELEAHEHGQPSTSPPSHSASKPHSHPRPSSVERSGLCVICQDEEACIAVVDCGHLAMCRECSDLVLASSRECPLCRTRIVTEARLLRIFKT